MLSLRRMQERQTVLADFGEFALRSDDLDAVLTQACRLVAEALGTGRAKLLEIEADGSTLFVRAGVGWDEGVVGHVRLPMQEHSSESYSISAGEPVISNDIVREDRFDFPAFIKDAGVKAIVNVPVFLPGGRAFGLLQVDASEARSFGDEDTQFLRTYATILGPVIDRLLKVHALSLSEERFCTIVEAARDYAILQTDLEDRITDWLPGAEAVFGWSAAEAIGQLGTILFTPEDRAAGVPELELEMARERGSAADVRWHQRKDGKRVFIHGSVVALWDKTGKLRGFQKIGQDVTQRRLAEEGARESEARHSLLIGSWAQAVWETDAAGVVVTDSPSWRAYTGQSVEEWLGYGWLNAIHPDDRAYAERQWREAMAAQSLVDAEFRLRAPHDGWRWTNVRAAPVRDAGGKIEKWVGININIDARKQAETSLRDSEARQAFLLRFSDAMRVEPNANAIVKRALQLLYEELGLDRCYAAVMDPAQNRSDVTDEVRRSDLIALPSPLHFFDYPEAVRQSSERTLVFSDTANDPVLTQTDKRSLAALSFGAFALRPVRRGAGNPIWTLGVVSTLPRRWTADEMALVEEATERTWAAAERAGTETALRKSEAKYRALFESIDEGFCIIDVIFDEYGRPIDYAFVETNPGFEHQAGFRIVAGQRMREIAPDHEQHWFDIYGRIALSGEPARFEHRAASFGIVYDVYAFRVDEPEQRRVAVLFRNITERKSAEEALRRGDRQKDIFLATLSHELRNPLAPIRTAAQLLTKAGLDAKQTDWAQAVIQRQVTHLSVLLDDLLDVSRITQGKLTLKRKRVGLAAIVDSAVEAARPLIDRKSHQLSVSLPDAPVFLSADPVRLAQVISNLLTNSAKYTDPGGHIELAACVDTDSIVLTVTDTDTGIGIAPDVLPQVFKMFTQVQGDDERADGGLGIGLALVKGLVGRHGGTVEATSDGVGLGSTFTVRLPRAECLSEGPVEQHNGCTGPCMRRKVLVADDNRDSADALAMLLQIGGHDTRVAYDGRAALSLAQAFRPDVALLDICMPGMNGYALARALRAEPWGQAMALVATTGWGQEDDRHRSAEAGFDQHLTKPVDPAYIETILSAHTLRLNTTK